MREGMETKIQGKERGTLKERGGSEEQNGRKKRKKRTNCERGEGVLGERRRVRLEMEV